MTNPTFTEVFNMLPNEQWSRQSWPVGIVVTRVEGEYLVLRVLNKEDLVWDISEDDVEADDWVQIV